MKTKKNAGTEFKKGDKVYAIKNGVWGRQPMTIFGVYLGVAICDHPLHGRANFALHNLSKKKPATNTLIKGGDKVYARYNMDWGMMPMTVLAIHSTEVFCVHPTLGQRLFCISGVVKVTPERDRQIRRMEALHREYNELACKLFELSTVAVRPSSIK